MNNLKFDKETVAAFCSVSLTEQIHLAAITPDGELDAKDFGSDTERAVSWAEEQNRLGRNIHFTANLVRPNLHRKPSKTDIVAPRFAYLDADPPKDGSFWDRDAVISNLQNTGCPPTALIDSGNGLQGIWRVEGADLERIEELNRVLIQRFGGDASVFNHDRLLRLPGTVNHPNKRKSALGYVPVLATIIQPDDGVSYNVTELFKEFGRLDNGASQTQRASRRGCINIGPITKLSSSALGLSKQSRLARLIDEPKGIDRSADTFALACEALREGYTMEQIVGVLLNHENAISAHCLSQEDPMRAARRAIERALMEDNVARRRRQREEDRLIGAGVQKSVIPLSGVMTLDEMIDRLVFVKDGSQVADIENPKNILSLSDFRNATAASTSIIEGEQRPKTIKNHVRWLSDPKRKTVERLTFRAGYDLTTDDPDGRVAFNTWRPPVLPDPPADWLERVKTFEEHIYWLFSDDAQAFLDWVSHMLQRPGELPSYGFLHIARNQGLGRNWIAAILGRIFQGMTALGFDLLGALNSGFNGELGGKILAIVDEIDEGTSGKSYQHAQALKKIVTEETRVINPKYGRQRVEFNVCRWLVFSNSSTALPLEDGDRRFWVVRSDAQPRDEHYYKSLYRLRKDPEFIASVAYWLFNRDISTFNPGRHPPLNDAKRALLERTRSPGEQMLHDVATYWPLDLVTSAEIFELMGEVRITGPALRHALDRARLSKVGEYKAPGIDQSRRRITIYARQNAEHWQACGLPKMRAHLDQFSFQQKLTMMEGSDLI